MSGTPSRTFPAEIIAELPCFLAEGKVCISKWHISIEIRDSVCICFNERLHVYRFPTNPWLRNGDSFKFRGGVTASHKKRRNPQTLYKDMKLTYRHVSGPASEHVSDSLRLKCRATPGWVDPRGIHALRRMSTSVTQLYA